MARGKSAGVRCTREGLLLVGFLAAGPLAAADVPAPGAIPVELWDRPRSGREVIALPSVREALAALAGRPESRVIIRHPAGAEGMLQAEELRAWLVAHAADPSRVTLRTEAAAGQPLRLEIVP